jgi:hypothetical protein
MSWCASNPNDWVSNCGVKPSDGKAGVLAAVSEASEVSWMSGRWSAIVGYRTFVSFNPVFSPDPPVSLFECSLGNAR